MRNFYDYMEKILQNFAQILRKSYRNFVEILRLFLRNFVGILRSFYGTYEKFCCNLVEGLWKFNGIFEEYFWKLQKRSRKFCEKSSNEPIFLLKRNKNSSRNLFCSLKLPSLFFLKHVKVRFRIMKSPWNTPSGIPWGKITLRSILAYGLEASPCS